VSYGGLQASGLKSSGLQASYTASRKPIVGAVRGPRSIAVSLVVACALAGGACATGTPSGGTPAPFPGAVVRPDAVRAPAVSALVTTILETALAQRGAPYRLGGSEPQKGFDCSGLVQYVFGQHHVDVPRTVAQQYRVGRSVKRRSLQRGDLVFFGPAGQAPTHVGIVIDDDTFVHAPDTGAVVRVERLDADYWRRRFTGAKRVV
jgi:cell wall-associated NlpC family hydrolase